MVSFLTKNGFYRIVNELSRMSLKGLYYCSFCDCQRIFKYGCCGVCGSLFDADFVRKDSCFIVFSPDLLICKECHFFDKDHLSCLKL